MTFQLDDYVDVPERIRLFNEKYPEGTLQGSGEFVYDQAAGLLLGYIYTARAYRHPEDLRPGVGTAFEKIPGGTPYTRDSEVMNAETSAWGRAIVAVGIPSKRIASQEEVQARRSDAQYAAETPGAVALPDEAKGKRTQAQNKNLHRILGELDSNQPRQEGDWKDYARQWTMEKFGKHSSADLSPGECGQLIDHLEALEIPFG